MSISNSAQKITVNAERFKRNCETKPHVVYSILLPKNPPSIGAFYSPNMVCPIIDFTLMFSGGEMIEGDAEGQSIGKEAIIQFNESGEYIEILFDFSKNGGVLIEHYDWMTQTDDISQDWIYVFLRVVSNIDERAFSNLILFHDFKSGKKKPQCLRISNDVYDISKLLVYRSSIGNIRR